MVSAGLRADSGSPGPCRAAVAASAASVARPKCSPGTLVTLRHAFVGGTRKALAQGAGELTILLIPEAPRTGVADRARLTGRAVGRDLRDKVRSYDHEI